MSYSNLVLDIRDVDSSTEAKIKKYFIEAYVDGFVVIGPKGYLFPKTPNIEEQMTSIHNMPVRENDIFVSTFPRSGTTLSQELVWLVANDLDYKAANSKHLVERYTTLGSYFINTEEMKFRLQEFEAQHVPGMNKLKKMITSPTEVLSSISGPRYIKCHIPISMLPPNVLDTAKMIYVARDPRDVAVSLYHLSKLLQTFSFVGDFKTFWEFFIKGLIVRSPFFEQVKEAWELRNHPNMLFLFYEDVSQNITSTIQKVSKFLGKSYTEDQVKGLSEHLKIENFSRNQSVNIDFLDEFGALVKGEAPFIRKGKSGGWQDYFNKEMAEQAKRWIEDNLFDTDLKFPDCD